MFRFVWALLQAVVEAILVSIALVPVLVGFPVFLVFRVFRAWNPGRRRRKRRQQWLATA